MPAIDHLRACAATLVLVYHSVHLISYQRRWHVPFAFDHWPSAGGNPFLALVYEGHSGVGLFIVLSGFIFTLTAQDREIRYGEFLRNRILRIYPLLLALVFAGLATFPDRFTLSAFLQTVLPLQNLPGALPLGPYDAMFWTIGVEFQFYLIFPFLHRLLTQQGASVLWAMILLVIVVRATGTALGANPSGYYLNIVGRLDQFLIGMIAATLASRVPEGSRGLVVLSTGLVGMLGALDFFNWAGGFPATGTWKVLWPTVEAVLWALVIVGYVAARRGRDGTAFSRWLAAVGVLSYSMYLVHFLVLTVLLDHHLLLQFAGSPETRGLLNGVLVVLPATLAVSFLTYRTIERPFLQMRHRYVVERPEGEPRGTKEG